jgi:hypothetical protein
MGVLGGLVGALILWFVWAGLTYLIGTKLLPTPETRADWGQLLRTTGFAAAPGLLRVFGALPLLGGLVFAVTGVWMFVCVVIAVRQALDYTSTLRAVAVCFIGWLIYAAILLMFVVPLH